MTQKSNWVQYLKERDRWAKVFDIKKQLLKGISSSMKSKILSILGMVALTVSISAIANDDGRRPPFYSALASMTDTGGLYTFMLDQLLETRCGQPQSIEYLKGVSQSYLFVIAALKDGKSNEAKVDLADIPCE